jgi:AbrB family looped-hinge helix DNA binding protein
MFCYFHRAGTYLKLFSCTDQNRETISHGNFYLALIFKLGYNLTSKINQLWEERYTMANLATTRMSSKGQVVIPEDIRKRLNLKAGSQFIVVGEKDVVILKSITPPSMDNFGDLIKKARRQGKKAGIKRSDIVEAVAKTRGGK